MSRSRPNQAGQLLHSLNHRIQEAKWEQVGYTAELRALGYPLPIDDEWIKRQRRRIARVRRKRGEG